MKPLYSCAQQVLYTICRTAWNACSNHLTVFGAHKPIYTAAYIADKNVAIEAAASLPNAPARSGDSQIYHVHLFECRDNCLEAYLSLTTYIMDAFPAAEYEIRLNVAGQSFYEGARKQNWKSVKSLVDAASKFITDNTVTLSDNLNMPATFPAAFEAARSAFAVQYQLYLDEENSRGEMTANKIKANNGIYTALKVMLKDGKVRFLKNKAIKKQFTYAHLHYLASGVGTSGIKGYIVDANTDLPISGVEISIPKKRRTLNTDKDGHYEILQIAAGTYKAKFSKEGYQPITMDALEIKLGTISSLNLIMVPIPQDDSES